MFRCFSESERVRVCIPDCFVRLPPPPALPLPVPGEVTLNDLLPPCDERVRFLVPWTPLAGTLARRDLVVGGMLDAKCVRSVPCDIDVARVAEHCAKGRWSRTGGVEETVRAVFKAHDNAETIVARVLESLKSPFMSRSGCTAESCEDPIVWTLNPVIQRNPSMSTVLGGKKLAVRHKILRGVSWSVVSYGEPIDARCMDYPLTSNSAYGVVKRNVIYDGSGDAVAQIDFGHGESCGIHCHALVNGNLEHKPGNSEDHSFPLEDIPWFWTCVPDVRNAGLIKQWLDRGEIPVCKDDFESDDDELTKHGSGWSVTSNRHLFGLADTSSVDGCSWANISLPFEDYNYACLDD